VDDDPSVREVMTEYLAGDGHRVEAAANGAEGLQKFRAGWFDVVITDQAMPAMSGDELAAAVKAQAPNKPVILVTGFGDLMLASGEKPGAVDCILPKPVTLAALREALSNACQT
jgi:DNA-binding NtrC family response regulator